MRTLLITGGAGFIGTNAAWHFHQRGWHVVLLDNLSRKGAVENLDWLRRQVQVRFERADVRDRKAIDKVLHEVRPDAVLHLAAQVAVTTSVTDPREDFEINAGGSLNVLEAIRQHSPATILINASTNKVYGKMDNIAVVERNGRYEYEDLRCGVGEEQPLSFHSPYGCSKGVADQYTLDYAKIYGLRTVSFRQSCIYGPRQFGIEDQGWVAWFAIAALLGREITLYGDGKQTRDLLHVQDLVRAYEAAIGRIDVSAGEAFNLGGGVDNVLSLLQVLSLIEETLGTRVPLKLADWRPGDQPVFASNLGKAARLLEWSPRIDARQGVQDLVGWAAENRSLFQ